jgi:hypothetical protein
VKQKIEVKLTVEFPDDTMQPDVNEAVVDAIKSLRGMLTFIPAVKGKSRSGKTVSFKIVDVEK